MKGICGSRLKVVACVSMLIDHMALHVFRGMDWAYYVFFQIGHREITPFFIMHSVFGRWAFPIIAFLFVEGFHYD